MKRQYFETVSIASGFILAAASIVACNYDPIWNVLRIKDELRGPSTIALSLFFLIGGFILSLRKRNESIQYLLQTHSSAMEDILQTHTSDIEKQLNTLNRSLPQKGLFAVFSCDEAHREIAKAIKKAAVALNTRVLVGETTIGLEPRHDSLKVWDRAQAAAMRAGGLIYRDVISTGFRTQAENLAHTFNECKGLYEASCINCSIAGVPNFIVLSYKDGTEEVWVGWVLSSGLGFDQPVFCCAEQRFVQMFKTWHSLLFEAGERISQQATQRPLSEG